METKLWTALCALLLVHMGFTDNSKPSESPLVTGVATEAATVPTSSLEVTSHPPPLNGPDTNTTSNGTSSLSSNTTSPQTPGLKENNDTSTVSPSESVAPENNTNETNKTEESAPPQIVLPMGNDTTSHIPPTTTTTTTTSSTQTTHSAPVNNTSSRPASLSPDSISPTVQSTNPVTHSSTTTATTISTSTQSSSTSSTSSPQEPKKTTVTPPSSTSTQAKAHVDTPSQLNMGGDMTMVHESPALDPLLAGLVSAFIITAVIITLLLFLKLRRRQNRPEFRRLQDLPMDDMMEDTPLSMYSY